jgi:hypothetical protein
MNPTVAYRLVHQATSSAVHTVGAILVAKVCPGTVNRPTVLDQGFYAVFFCGSTKSSSAIVRKRGQLVDHLEGKSSFEVEFWPHESTAATRHRASPWSQSLTYRQITDIVNTYGLYIPKDGMLVAEQQVRSAVREGGVRFVIDRQFVPHLVSVSRAARYTG